MSGVAMGIEVDVDDSTELLYATLKSNEDIPEEALNGIISNVVGAEIRSIYNNREQIVEQLEEQQQAPEQAGAVDVTDE